MGSVGPQSQPGSRLLHVTVDEIGKEDPNRPYASLPLDDDNLAKGYEDIDFRTFANAINRLAWYIESCLGSNTNVHTYAYIGRPDLRYAIMSLATAKLQKRVLFSSHLHSTEAHLNLMSKTHTTVLFIAEGVDVDDIIEGRPMLRLTIPSLSELLDPTPVEHYSYTKSFSEAKLDDFLILHSSGSTGLPKPITINHAAFACLDNQAALPRVDGSNGQQRRFLTNPGFGTRMLIPFMPFHGISSFVMPVGFVFWGAVYIPGMRNRLIKASDTFSVIDHSKAQEAFLSPATIEDIISYPEAGKYLSKLRTLYFGGATMTTYAANTAAKYTNLANQWGTTESGKGIEYVVAPEDHAYNAWDLKNSGMRFQPLPSTDPEQPAIYKLFVDPTPASLPYTAFFTRSPARKDLQPWDVGDLWLAHPDPKKAAFTFRFLGRADDLISFKDGNNFHPTDWEMAHAEHSLIRSAVLAGVGHRQVVLLLELHESEEVTNNIESLTQRIWQESIHPINARANAQSKVTGGHLVIVNGNAKGGFERSAKGTVARKPTLKKFEDEIEECYAKAGDESNSGINVMARVK